ncbi:acetyl-CoA carboxylase biotin carboxyl carrier protein subunit [Algoriphagus confluentis]|uniref:Acetyl-CoA carboxylase biotin carboxyl carrier protein subunit n=1 Tax=Algoriphagus confluentis TaxID=1697556 RepID=A0ABQ6PJS6_9BACT|nr:acetyl-CoA carboxylase biotin carboxyl carrier protein subunit [Algoriphagus confluentis]
MFSVIIQNETYQVEKNDGFFQVEGKKLTWDIQWLGDGKIHLIKGNESMEAELIDWDRETKSMRIRLGHQTAKVQLKDRFDLLLEKMGMSAIGSGAPKDIKAPMPGLILDLKVKSGDEVKKGDVVLILEAMKMENIIKAPGDGTVKEVKVSLKQSVEKNQVLIQF